MMLVIVSGRSGSGKSVALHALEDMGFYCVDNLPISMLPELAKIVLPQQRPVAISLDIRNFPKEKQQLDAALSAIPESFTPHLVYLDSFSDTLIRRYNESRRLHPLASKNLSLEESIQAENKLLKPLREQADLIINTSSMSVHELSAVLQARLLGKQDKQLLITIESFGFKYGLPASADYVFDVRFLNNPHWIPELKNLTGLDQPVRDFLSQHTEVHHFIYQTSDYLEQWLPMLERNNRNYLTVAIGCTGGKHRSVYVAEQIAEHFRLLGKQVNILHRNINS